MQSRSTKGTGFFIGVGTLVFGSLVCGMVGCSGSGVGTLVPVKGQITLNGKPLKGGTVTFIASGSNKQKLSKSTVAGDISNGSYSIKTDGEDGAPLGDYKVIIIPAVEGGPDPTKTAKDGVIAQQPPTPIFINPKYQDPDQTPLTVKVVDSPTASAYNLKLGP